MNTTDDYHKMQKCEYYQSEECDCLTECSLEAKEKVIQEDEKNGMYEEPDDEGCTCQSCGRTFKVDIMVPDDIWAVIMVGNGLLCGPCITGRIEDINTYAAFKLTRL